MKIPEHFNEERYDDLRKKFYEFLLKEMREYMKPGSQKLHFLYAQTTIGHDRKEKMSVALIFWEFVRKQVSQKYEERRYFVLYMMNRDPLPKANEQVRTVCMAEALPTPIWRKLLNKEHIDFSDYEDFLRRLTSEQRSAIADNYSDMFLEIKLPRILQRGWWDRLKLWLNPTTVTDLLQRPFGYDQEDNKIRWSSHNIRDFTRPQHVLE